MDEPARDRSSPRDRRRGDRRQGDRRRGGRPFDASWFGTLELDGDSQARRAGRDGDSGYAGDWARVPQAADSRFLSRQARRLSAADAGAFHRIYRLFVGARAALGLALMLALVAGQALGFRQPWPPFVIMAVYAVEALLLWLLPHWHEPRAGTPPGRLRRVAWLVTIGFDMLAFSALHLLDPVSNVNYAALLVLPVLMAGVLTPRLQALAIAAGAALVLLAAGWRTVLAGADAGTVMTPVGLTGMGFFIIVLVVGELAGRLAREEVTARGSLELARQQARLNRLVIDEMGEGVLVIDRRARVRTANPAARALLVPDGSAPAAPFPLADMPAWAALAEVVERAFREGSWPESGRDVSLAFGPGSTRTLRVRVRFTRRSPQPASGEGDTTLDGSDEHERLREPFCVLFVEDVRTVQARTRQEKLAAMGRVSAGIAHEIRNPLAAIAQANALLLEDELPPPQQRLARIVADNVARLKRIVDDVLEVAPGEAAEPHPIDATAEVGNVTADWAQTAGLKLGVDGPLQVQLPATPLGVLFDPDHLRRVLVNLLDNARRHATGGPGAIGLELAAVDAWHARLVVGSDGPPIPADVERHLFEPFFSTRSRGTGLGLYICRELCERYGASIDYRPRPPGEARCNEFVVTMRLAPLARTEARLHP